MPMHASRRDTVAQIFHPTWDSQNIEKRRFDMLTYLHAGAIHSKTLLSFKIWHKQ